jgi:hypothetical protein
MIYFVTLALRFIFFTFGLTHAGDVLQRLYFSVFFNRGSDLDPKVVSVTDAFCRSPQFLQKNSWRIHNNFDIRHCMILVGDKSS